MNTMTALRYLQDLQEVARKEYASYYAVTWCSSEEFRLKKADAESFISNEALFTGSDLYQRIVSKMTCEMDNPVRALAEILYEVQNEDIKRIEQASSKEEVRELQGKISEITQLLVILKAHFTVTFVDRFRATKKTVLDKIEWIFGPRSERKLTDWDFLPLSVIKRRINHPDLYPYQNIPTVCRLSEYNPEFVEDFLKNLKEYSVNWDVYFTPKGFSGFFEMMEPYLVGQLLYEDYNDGGKSRTSVYGEFSLEEKVYTVKFYFDQYEDGAYRLLGYLMPSLVNPDYVSFVDLSDKVDHFSLLRCLYSECFDKWPLSEFVSKYILLFD